MTSVRQWQGKVLKSACLKGALDERLSTDTIYVPKVSDSQIFIPSKVKRFGVKP